MRIRLWSVVAVLSLIAVFAPGATAGGWATAAVVEDVDSVTVGSSFTIRYVVRAHGIVGHEMDGMETSVQFSHQESSQVVETLGKATPDPKVYEATATLPAAGGWKWMVVIHNYLAGESIESPMPTLMATVPGQALDVGAAKASGMTIIVTITDGGFTPATVEVEVGDTITWVNDGQMPHQVASHALGFETSPMIQPGEAFFQTMVDPGTFDYLCPPHPGMIGEIVVK